MFNRVYNETGILRNLLFINPLSRVTKIFNLLILDEFIFCILFNYTFKRLCRRPLPLAASPLPVCFSPGGLAAKTPQNATGPPKIEQTGSKEALATMCLLPKTTKKQDGSGGVLRDYEQKRTVAVEFNIL